MMRFFHSKSFLMGILIGIGFFFVLGVFLIGWIGYATVWKPSTYLILLQNNFELRPTGGFLGSYAKLHIEKGRILDVSVHDIYTPDGQLEGHVDPPWPIQAAFGQGWYRLRDSNFDPDFPTAVTTMRWFFEQGKEDEVDGVIAIDLRVFGEILSILGPLHLTQTSDVLTPDSFYTLMQSNVELGFFPGSQQKRVYLQQVATATRLALGDSSPVQKVKIFGYLVTLASQRHIQIISDFTPIQFLVKNLHWDGSLIDRRKNHRNTFILNEANLSTNKANCCIERFVEIDIRQEGDFLHQIASIQVTNQNPFPIRKPPYFWGGAYLSFFRVYIPIEASIQSIQVGEHTRFVTNDTPFFPPSEPLVSFIASGSAIATQSAMQVAKRTEIQEKGLQEIGFLVFVDAQATQSIKLKYSIPTSAINSPSQIAIQKQSGIQSIPYTVNRNGRKHQIEVMGFKLLR